MASTTGQWRGPADRSGEGTSVVGGWGLHWVQGMDKGGSRQDVSEGFWKSGTMWVRRGSRWQAKGHDQSTTSKLRVPGHFFPKNALFNAQGLNFRPQSVQTRLISLRRIPSQGL